MPKFVIRERKTSTYCSSSASRLFGDIDDAVLFISEGTALKAIRGMFPKTVSVADIHKHSWCAHQQVYLSTDQDTHRKAVEFYRSRGEPLNSVAGYLQAMLTMIPDFEVVEVKIVPV